VGSTNVIFTIDANTGPTRTGSLTIAGQTLSITQVGSTYMAAGPISLLPAGPRSPFGLAVDSSGNVYFADSFNQTIQKWTAASQTLSNAVGGLNSPYGVALDGAGNIYIADSGANYIDEWNSTNNTLGAVYYGGLSHPEGVAVDAAGNVYIADTYNGAIKEWLAANRTITNLVTSGLIIPQGLAVDSAGNVYIADSDNNAIKEWFAETRTVTTLVSTGLSNPAGVAVDAAGNVYIADGLNKAVERWNVGINSLTTLISSGLGYPSGVAVDTAGNVYVADYNNAKILELPRAFADTAPRLEPMSAGNDSLPPVVPATADLSGVFYPTSDQPWLTITGVTGGRVGFSVTATTTNRTAHINVLGVSVPVVQNPPVAPPLLTGTSVLPNGALQFTFTNNPNASFTVLASTNLFLPVSNWSVAGTPTDIGGGNWQFIAPAVTNSTQIYYRVRSP
jgi:sugar lactone lactonase YvrE